MVNFCFDIIGEVKRKGVSLGLEFHECHRRNTLLRVLLNLLLLFQKEKLAIWTQLNLKTIKFQVPINLRFIKTHPAYIKTETVKEIKHVWVTYSAGCSLTTLQNDWNNEVQFCYEVLVPPWSCLGRPPRTRAKYTGKLLVAPIPRPLHPFRSPASIPTTPAPALRRGFQDAAAAGCAPRASHPASLQEGPSKAGTRSSSPRRCWSRGEQKRCKSKGEKSKAISGGRICLPVPVKLKREGKTKAAGITLQRNGL